MDESGTGLKDKGRPFFVLAVLGVDGGGRTTVSYGKELPLDPGHNEGAWAKNRRSHFLAVEK